MKVSIKKALLLSSAVAVAIAGCGSPDGVTQAGPAQPPADGYLLQVNQQEGDVNSYDVEMEMDMTTPAEGRAEGMPEKIEGEMSMSYDVEVKSVEEDQYTFELILRSVAGTTNGEPMPTPTAEELSQPMTMVIDKQGKTVSMDGNMMAASSPIGTPGMSGMSFPDHKVKVGDTWSSEVDLGGTPVQVEYTLTGVEQVDGVNAVVIESRIMDNEMMSTPEPMKAWVHPVTGVLLRSEGVLVLDMMGMTANMVIRVNKVQRAPTT